MFSHQSFYFPYVSPKQVYQVSQGMNVFIDALEKWNQFPWKRNFFTNAFLKEVALSSPMNEYILTCFVEMEPISLEKNLLSKFLV